MSAIPLKNGCFWVSGSTCTGKTTWTRKLIRFRDEMFEDSPEKVYYCYREYQPSIFHEIEEKEGVVFHQGLPALEKMKEWSREADERHVMVVFDDLQNSIVSNPEMPTAFGVLAHHCNMSLVALVQNLYPKGRWSKDVALNCCYVILMNNKRDRMQISTLARQLCPGKHRFFMESYEDSAVSRNYGYLFVNLHPSSPETHMLTTDIFPDEMTVIYRPK